MILTKKQTAFLETYINNPLKSNAELARMSEVSEKQVCHWKKDPEFQAELQRRLDENWKEYGVFARQKMVELADKGDYRAVEFLAKTNGLNPAQQVNVDANVKTISVTIDEE